MQNRNIAPIGPWETLAMFLKIADSSKAPKRLFFTEGGYVSFIISSDAPA